MRFSGQVAIVTGSGSGIGEATARLLAGEGARVVVVDMVGERVERVVGAITGKGGAAIGVVADLRSIPNIERTISTTLDKYSRIDVLVNNAGVGFQGGLLDTPEEEWDRLLDTNLRAVYRCARSAAPAMIKAGRGKIVNVASNMAFQSSPTWLAYGATKGAVAALTRAMALDLIRHKIWVNAVCPGGTRTNISTRPAHTIPVHEPMASVPLGYRSEPEDQARVILFLASADSDYMVGQCLLVDGGGSVVAFPRSSPWASETGR